MSDRDTYRSQFAAYFAGKLSADEADALEQALAQDAKLAREAEAVRPVVDQLADAAEQSSADFRLSADRIALIRAAASRQIVAFPATAIASHRDVSVWRKLGPALAATVAVVIGAVSGFSSGRGSFDGGPSSFLMATEIEPASVPDSDAVYYYPPAYGLDHYEQWGDSSAWRATGIGLSAVSQANYGLPGPRSAYLVPGNTFFWQ